MNNKIKYFLYLLGFIIIILLFGNLVNKLEVNANYDDLIGDKVKIIGCINTVNNHIKEPTKLGGCFYGKYRQNIMIPNKEQWKVWKEVFGDDRSIINRLAIVNFESGFNEDAENYRAKGYVQTLKKYNIDSDIKSQLTWMKNRQDFQKQVITNKWSGTKGCGYYWDNYNFIDKVNAGEEAVLSCLYRYHYHATKGTWYAKKALATRNYYFKYFNIK